MQSITLLLCLALSVRANIQTPTSETRNKPEGRLGALLLALHPTLSAPTYSSVKHKLSARNPHRSDSRGAYMQSDGNEDTAVGEQADFSSETQAANAKMKSQGGVEFAPWMKIDAEAIAKAKAERSNRKKQRQAAISDAMLIDPQAAELGAGGGLKSKVLSEEEVELRWDTQDEVGNEGFIVQRRKGGSENFQDIASYDNFAPLRTKGANGGSYVYLDDTIGVGTWVYRILDCDTTGKRSAVCQKLVEVTSEAEGKQTILVGVAILGLAILFVLFGLLADPIQSTDKGGAFF